MKKVRKSLALDVADCQVMPKSRRKSLRTEIKNSIMVSFRFLDTLKKKKRINLCHHKIQFYVFLFLFLFFLVFVAWQEEPVLLPLSSSSVCSKQHENILDQGFLLGPSDSAIFPSMQQPLPASATLFFFFLSLELDRTEYNTFINLTLENYINKK